MSRNYQIGISFLLVFIISACATTTKKKGKPSWLKRNFHSVTTKYNYYYNANVLLQEGIAKLNAQHNDNYNQILDMYPYSAVENAESVAGDMDLAVKKMSTAAAIHRYGDWVDDCALLMAKAQYMKKDYESAEETLLYLTENLKPKKNKKVAAKERKETLEAKKKETKAKQSAKKKANEKKKKANAKQKAAAKKQAAKNKGKKASEKTNANNISFDTEAISKDKAEEDDDRLDFEPKQEGNTKPKRYWFKRRPAYQEGLAWLARTFTERKKYEEAESILVNILKQRATPRSIRRIATQYYAYNLLKQKEYGKAVKPLERAIKLTKNRKQKARFYYILGQIQEKQLRDADALQAYEKVLAYKSIPYDMEFSARMNVALFAYTKGQGSADNAVKTLQKMARESKNEDYRDQIYFALAQIAMKSNDKKLAIENLQKSLQYSKKNASQKAEAYLMMADLYFKEEDFLKAKNYYDSTITVLPKTDERFEEAKRLAFGLTDIAKSLKIIQYQDSLLRIAAMSPEAQKDFLLKLKQKNIEAQEKAAAAALAAAQAKGVSSSDFAITYGPGVTPSTFFAYNNKGIVQGKKQFDQKWNKRPLEDDWRRSNKKVTGAGNVADNSASKENNNKVDKNVLTDEEYRKMMANVPQNEMQITAANGEIANAMLILGKGYKDVLQRDDKSVKVLEDLLRKYPDTKHELEAYYYLYNAYNDMNNTIKAKEYYDKIVSKYPNTTYARILSDPDFVKKAKKQGQELDDYYKATYEAFDKKQYQVVIDRSSKADSIFKVKNIYKPKFALLSAMSLGNIAGKEKYIAAIKEVIAKFPETPEQKRAKEILRLLDGGEAAYKEIVGEKNANLETGIYKRDDESMHYIIVVLTGKNARIEEAKSKIADFNADNYKSKNLKTSNVMLGDDNNPVPMLIVRKFDDRNSAMKYYDHAQKVKEVFMVEDTPYEIYAISQANYKELMKDRKIEIYKAFFDFVYKEK